MSNIAIVTEDYILSFIYGYGRKQEIDYSLNFIQIYRLVEKIS
jgi:hypothetical protein